ncbi:hypothetical protein IQ07DRAFT_159687 [Pyrenochaeta sp. DS3sAY3a]|nr:hypothetical protein IQ07DRAFT_159687 [Pyrenochaeta sp. DS3sAY3a]
MREMVDCGFGRDGCIGMREMVNRAGSGSSVFSSSRFRSCVYLVLSSHFYPPSLLLPPPTSRTHFPSPPLPFPPHLKNPPSVLAHTTPKPRFPSQASSADPADLAYPVPSPTSQDHPPNHHPPSTINHPSAKPPHPAMQRPSD